MLLVEEVELTDDVLLLTLDVLSDEVTLDADILLETEDFADICELFHTARAELSVARRVVCIMFLVNLRSAFRELRVEET